MPNCIILHQASRNKTSYGITLGITILPDKTLLLSTNGSNWNQLKKKLISTHRQQCFKIKQYNVIEMYLEKTLYIS